MRINCSILKFIEFVATNDLHPECMCSVIDCVNDAHWDQKQQKITPKKFHTKNGQNSIRKKIWLILNYVGSYDWPD